MMQGLASTPAGESVVVGGNVLRPRHEELGETVPDREVEVLTAVELAGLLAEGRFPADADGPSRSGALLLKVLVHMSQHACSPTTTVESIAAAHGVTRRALELHFAKVGATPATMLRSFRIGRASGLMLKGDRPEQVATIAELAGFGSVSALSRAFQRETGMTPAAWRRQYRSLTG